MVLFKIILLIVVIAALAGVLAFIADLFQKRNSRHRPYGLYEKFM